MTELTTAVIGVGYLGKFHADKYAQLPGAKLLAVVDTEAARAHAVADRLGVEAFTDYRELFGRVEAVSIVVPTSLHFEITAAFLQHGTHVLVEKPITTTVEQAQRLILLAQAKGLILQVGHLERFNTAILDLDRMLNQPLFIESHRLAPFKPRGTDVSVILDLMIHDIDIILHIVNSPLKRIDASGAAVLSDVVDIANARLVFESGCVANVTASRVSMKSERKMRVFQPDAYISVDFQDRALTRLRKGNKEMFPGIATIETEKFDYQEGDALKTEIELFLRAIREGTPPVVSGEAGKQALQAAIQITDLLARQKLSEST
jgi:predicted dehydrogenase